MFEACKGEDIGVIPELPVKRSDFKSALTSNRPKSIIRASEFRIEPYRKVVQFAFALLVLAIGIQFALFVRQLEHGIAPTFPRPSGVEAFLPISALISLKYWLLTGIFTDLHPAGLVLFLLILATGLFLKKGFCGWICPFGLLSEYLAKFRSLLFKRPLKYSQWWDYPLRGLKYLLLGFFLWAILIKMDVVSLEKFLGTPYNKVADIKMLYFFTRMDTLTFWVLTALVLLSVLLPYFWCRYLCPYGALLGALSWLSPLKIHRRVETCIDCAKCAKACPMSLKVDMVETVYSDECQACLKCVDSCPVKDTLYLSVTKGRGKIPRIVYALSIVGLFLIVTTIARVTGYWRNSLDSQEYLYHIKHIAEYGHNRGAVP
jgi:polyferredoxin